MSDTTADISALHDFQVDAHVLLTRAQECLSHLDLIGHDTDACDCLLNTLGTLAERAHLQAQTQIADFCRQLCNVLEPQQCRARLHAALPKLKACLSLLAWQLELIDPHTGQLNLDPQEQLALLEELEQTFRQLHAEPAKATATPAAPAPALGA